MNKELLDTVVNEQIERCRELLIVKAEEYAPEDRLANFKKAASAQGVTLKQALGGMMAKHTISIYDMIWSGEEYDFEKWEEKITDHINYLLLLNAILEEEVVEGALEGVQSLRAAAAAVSASMGNIPTVDISPGDED